MKYYIESFWPREPEASGREFALWFHEKKISHVRNFNLGDRVLLYETSKHPDHKWRGAMCIFASVTLVGELQRFPLNSVSEVGGEKWNIMIPIQTDVIVPRDRGIEWKLIREILGKSQKFNLRQGMGISKSEFIQIENILKRGIYDERDIFIDGETETDLFLSEGKKIIAQHRSRERDSTAAYKKKKLALQQHGTLTCSVCGFSFEEKYGYSGKKIIDIHHTKPLSTYVEGDTTRIKDLALVCSNCHRMIHSSRVPYTINEIRKMMKAEK